jgi:aminocarboxymuconate-semialdehyde decarboxylase
MTMELIDVHAHVVPNHFPANPNNERWPCMRHDGATAATVMIGAKAFRELDDRSWDVSRRIADMDRDHVTMQALSPMPELLSYWFTAQDGLEMARWMNHSIAAMVTAAPTRFAGLGIVPLQDPALAAAELTRLKADGFCGVEIGSNINGVLLGDRRFEEFYAEAARLDLALFVHALHPVGADRLQAMPDLVPFAAFPLDTALTAIALLRAGVPERFPDLRIGFSHGGGAIVPLVHRLGQGWQLTNGFGGAMPHPPKHYAERFFYDSLVYDRGYLRHLVDEFAPRQVFAGTDYPYAIMETQLHDFLLGAAATAPAELFHGTALRFLGLASS